jgi:hypothetical protein
MVKNTKFFNFNFGGAASLGSCSHCSHPASTDSGARVVKFEKLWFEEETVTKRIRYGTPYKAIFLDLDGTLTGLGANTWATPWANHHDVPECQNSALHGGAICDSTIQVRRVVFNSYAPTSLDF